MSTPAEHLHLRRQRRWPATGWPCWRRVFGPTTAAFLRRDALPTGAPTLAVDLGCGPGYTTALVARCGGPARTVGLERSRRLRRCGPASRARRGEGRRRVPPPRRHDGRSRPDRPTWCSPATCSPTCPTRWPCATAGSPRSGPAAGCCVEEIEPHRHLDRHRSPATSSGRERCRRATAPTCWSAAGSPRPRPVGRRLVADTTADDLARPPDRGPHLRHEPRRCGATTRGSRPRRPGDASTRSPHELRTLVDAASADRGITWHHRQLAYERRAGSERPGRQRSPAEGGRRSLDERVRGLPRHEVAAVAQQERADVVGNTGAAMRSKSG